MVLLMRPSWNQRIEMNYLSTVRIKDRTFAERYNLQYLTSYVCLGFTGMQDELVLVNEKGIVITIPFDHECIIVA